MIVQVAHEELTHTAATLDETLASTKADLDKQRALNERLENDLLHINNAGSSMQREPSATAAPTDPSSVPASTSGLSGLELGSKTPAVRRTFFRLVKSCVSSAD